MVVKPLPNIKLEDSLAVEDKLVILETVLGKNSNVGTNQKAVLQYLLKKRGEIKISELDRTLEKLNEMLLEKQPLLKKLLNPKQLTKRTLKNTLMGLFHHTNPRILEIKQNGIDYIYTLRPIEIILAEIPNEVKKNGST